MASLPLHVSEILHFKRYLKKNSNTPHFFIFLQKLNFFLKINIFTTKRKHLLQYLKVKYLLVRLLFTYLKPSLSFIFFHSFNITSNSEKLLILMKQKISDVQRYGHGRFSPSAEHKKITLNQIVGLDNNKAIN